MICGEGQQPKRNLLKNLDHVGLINCCRERASLGETKWTALADKLTEMTVLERESLCYHSECRKPIVNRTSIDRLMQRKRRSESPLTRVGPGRPSTSTGGSTRPKRSKTTPKAAVCLFSACSFCPGSSEQLHQVLTDSMGESLMRLKKTQNDQVRTCVSDLESAGDASALEKHYHRNCLILAKRTCTEVEDKTHDELIRSLCDEELLFSVQNSLVDDRSSMNLNEVNEAYESILQKHNVQGKGI